MAEKNITKPNEKNRPPIVTIMGHVDHGKTSILDAIRKTNVVSREYGGITQHIGAYQITYKDHKITFIDTPGHSAFERMRARGGKASDVVVLVVAADEGVMPQTKEAILHIRAAGVPVIVAFNKTDLAGSDVQKAKQQLAQENILVEDWGGDVVCVEVSAKTGNNLDKLLDSILAVSELLELKADVNGELEAVIIESKVDRKRGVVVSCIVRNGSIKVGNDVSASGQVARIKSIVNDLGEVIFSADPGDPVEVLGFKKVANVGDLIVRKGSVLTELSEDLDKVEIIGVNTKKVVGIIVRADTQGTLEAVKASLATLVTENASATFSLKFHSLATGDITDSDVFLASSTKSVIVGFNVNASSGVFDLAEARKVIVKTYKTIYELVDDVKDVLEFTAVEDEAKIKGRAKVLKVFKLPSGDLIAGCIVLAGSFKNGKKVSIYDKDPDDLTKDDAPLYTGVIKKLKRGKDDIEVAGKDTECGILLKPVFEEIKEGFYIERLTL